jgi:hypothetical protein
LHGIAGLRIMVAMPRPRRILFIALGFVTAMLLAGAFVWAFLPRMAITRENAAKIQEGMTLVEVEALLGGPERIETTGPTEGDSDDGPDAEREAGERFIIALTHTQGSRRSRVNSSQRTWGSDRVAIFVVFDADERVIDFAVRPLRRAPESLSDLLRRWLGL